MFTKGLLLRTDVCRLVISKIFLVRRNTNFFNASFLILSVYTHFSLDLENFYNYDEHLKIFY